MKYDILYCHLSLSFLFFFLLCVPFKDEGWCVGRRWVARLCLRFVKNADATRLIKKKKAFYYSWDPRHYAGEKKADKCCFCPLRAN